MREAEAPLLPTVACERIYQIVVDGEAWPLLCRWFVPTPHPEGDWECQIQIIGPGDRLLTRAIGGADSVQALMLALSSVAADLLVSNDPVYQFEPDDDFGLPMMEIVAKEFAERKARFEAR